MERKRSHEDEFPSYSSQRRYHYEYELSEDNNSIVDPPERTVFNLVSTVRINFRVHYILRKRKIRLSNETLDSIERCFYTRLYLITGLGDYRDRVASIPKEFRQQREDMEYDLNEPETFLIKFLKCHGVVDDDVIKTLIGDTKDNVVKRKTRLSSNNRVLPIVISIKVYTLQQEGETINDAKQRAITPNLLKVKRADCLIKLLERPPPYKFMIEFDDDDEILRGDCGICLSKHSVGEEVLLLSCSHAYHYDCLLRWLDEGNQCPVCRYPMNLQNFMRALNCRVDNHLARKRQMRGIH